LRAKSVDGAVEYFGKSEMCYRLRNSAVLIGKMVGYMYGNEVVAVSVYC
jgi:hypothetical protein